MDTADKAEGFAECTGETQQGCRRLQACSARFFTAELTHASLWYPTWFGAQLSFFFYFIYFYLKGRCTDREGLPFTDLLSK